MHPKKPKLDDAIKHIEDNDKIIDKLLDRTGYDLEDLSTLSSISKKRLRQINNGSEITDREKDIISHTLGINKDDI